MSRDAKYALITVTTVVAFVSIVFGAVMFGASAALDVQCKERWKDRNPEWSFFTGCMIDTKEGRIPTSNYRVL